MNGFDLRLGDMQWLEQKKVEVILFIHIIRLERHLELDQHLGRPDDWPSRSER